MTSRRKLLVDEISVVASRVAGLIRQQPDTNVPIKGTEWTIGDAIAHIIISQVLSRKIFQGGNNPYKNAKPETIAAMNAQLLSEFKERDGSKLATLLTIETDNLLKEIARHDDSYVVKTHFNEMDLLTCLSYNLCHLLIHGCVVAAALKKPLPIEEKHIAMVLPFLKQGMPVTFDKEAAKDFVGTFTVHLSDDSFFAIIIDNGSLKVQDETPKHVDCHITADAVSYFFAASGGVPIWKPVLQGKIKAGGPKPWLALKLPKLFKTP